MKSPGTHLEGEQVLYVGNPLMEKYMDLNHYQAASKKIVLLPGSRVQEISRLLPVFNALAKELTEYNFHVVRAPSVRSRWPKKVLEPNITIEDSEIVEVTKDAEFALTCSGTASLEIALLGIHRQWCTKRMRYFARYCKTTCKRSLHVPAHPYYG